jgi:hypothetical protein
MISLAATLHALSALCAGGAAASGWTVSVVIANIAFDGLDHGRADRHLRQSLVSSAPFQAGLMALAAAFALFSGAFAASLTAAVAAFGFLANLWTLAPSEEKTPQGVRRKRSTRRIVAVALTLMVTAAALTAGVLAAFGV